MAAGKLQNITYKFGDGSVVTFFPEGKGRWRVDVELEPGNGFGWEASQKYKPGVSRAAMFRASAINAIRQAAEAGK